MGKRYKYAAQREETQQSLNTWIDELKTKDLNCPQRREGCIAGPMVFEAPFIKMLSLDGVEHNYLMMSPGTGVPVLEPIVSQSLKQRQFHGVNKLTPMSHLAWYCLLHSRPTTNG